MPKCKKCSCDFKSYYKDIDNKSHNLCNRKYCLTCVPFGTKMELQYNCRECGESDKKLFYGKQNRICAKCHNKNVLQRGNEIRKMVIKKMGEKCCKCGYSKYIGALEIHHLSPKTKDSTFSSWRGWSVKRIETEIKDCILLCRNCHAEEHNRLRQEEI